MAVAASGAGRDGNADGLLMVDRLCVHHGRVPALNAVSLRVGRGEIVAVIGPNGAGKTTLLTALIGAIPSRGVIRFDGVTHSGATAVHEVVGRGLALVPERHALFASMTVEDNLLLGAFRFRRESRRRTHETLDEVYSLFPRLKERRGQTASTLSGGERQMLALGRALMSRPRLLMLDEPSLGLAPLIVREIFRIFGELRERNVSILLVEQNARAAM